MGLFENDKEKDARIEQLLGDKVSSADVDPGIVALNEQLGVARDEYEKMSAAAEE
jgi:hypothetical protein